MDLVLVHLYPDLLSTYGDRGNVLCLARRAAWRGFDVTVIPLRRGEPLPGEADLIFMGGGQDRCQRLAAPDLLARGPEMRRAAESGSVVFGVCGGYQMLGAAYSTDEGDIPGLGLLDLRTEAGQRRLIGNVAVRATLWGQEGTLVGFENHAGRTLLGPGAEPLGTVLAGAGNNGEDGNEGAVRGSVLGTYLHGPVLPRNPWFADLLIERALARRHGDVTLEPLEDAAERLAHAHGLDLARRRGRPA